MSSEKPVVVIDNGSYNIKAGFACDNHPVSIFRSLVGRPAYLNGTYGKELYDVQIGENALNSEEDLELVSPIVRGRIVHWDNMERIWHHIFYRELKVAPEDRAVILGCAADTTMAEKVQCCEVFFETLNAPALCIQPQSVLSLYGSGFTTGICVDLGHDKAEVTPVYEGGLFSYAIINTNLSSRGLYKFITECFDDRGLTFEKTEQFFEHMKNTIYVTQDIAINLRNYRKYYQLPDGNKIDISNEAFMIGEFFIQTDEVLKATRLPSSTYSKTEYVSLPNAVLTASLKCDPDLRPNMYEAIVLCGGWSSITGLGKRLGAEMDKLVSTPATVLCSPESYTVSWLGGATFAGMPDAKKLWVTKKQYEDYGAKIVKNKFL